MNREELRGYPISFKIKYLRNENQWTVADFANKMQCCVTSITYWENGKRKPSFKNIVQMSKVFKVSVDFFTDIYETVNFKNKK
jgi:transcriptional regulator with XRE-family HTH domain